MAADRVEGRVMFSSGQRELAVLDQASRLLADAQSLEDIKAVRDKAEAARTYARAAKLGLDLQNRAAELKLRAERKAGQFLGSLKLRGGDRRSKGHHVTLKLGDLGISRQQSKRWQRMASLSEREFCEYFRATNELGREITSAGLLRIARKAAGQTHKKVVSAFRPTISPAACNACLASNESIIELINHCQLLAEVLRPVYQESQLELKQVDRRIVGRLLGEMHELLRQLQKDWSRDSHAAH